MSMASYPIKPSKFDFSKVSFSAPRAMGSSGAKMLYVNYDNKPLSIQLPEMRVGWDLKYYEDQNPGSGKYQVSLKFDKTDDKRQSEMHELLDKLDELLVKTCYENRAAWIKKAGITEDGVKLLYTPLIKRSIDKETGEINGKWPDEFRIKLVKREGACQFKLFDENKAPIDLSGEGVELEELIKKDSNLKGVISCNGVWIASGKFGCTWKGQQLKVETPKMKEYAFEDTDSDEEDGSEKEAEHSDSDSDSGSDSD
jgi:hypothetical protein